MPIFALSNNRELIWDGSSLDDVYVTYGKVKEEPREMNKFSLDEIYEGSDVHSFALDKGKLEVERKREVGDDGVSVRRIDEENRRKFRLTRAETMMVVSVASSLIGFDDVGIEGLFESMDGVSVNG